jgi:hypothetical protein
MLCTHVGLAWHKVAQVSLEGVGQDAIIASQVTLRAA